MDGMGQPERCRDFSCVMNRKAPAMATHMEDELGSPTELIPTDRQTSRTAFVRHHDKTSNSGTKSSAAAHEGGEAMNPDNKNRKLAEKIELRWYQTNASLSQPPTTGFDRPVREYVTNVSWRAAQ
jgi:hypothetical protein